MKTILLHFICECSDAGSDARNPITLSVYQKIHENRGAFIIKPKHQVKEIETITETEKDYGVVEKNKSTAKPEGTLNITPIKNSQLFDASEEYNVVMEHNTLFKLIYTLILGVVLALFLGVGVSAFYEPPKPPEYPYNTFMYKEASPQTEVDIQRQEKFDKDSKEYEEIRQVYERNVSVILLILAIVTIAIGLVFARHIGFLSDGILLGGLFTLVHALIRGFEADDSKYLFAAATVAVVVVLYLGYRRFGKALDTAAQSNK